MKPAPNFDHLAGAYLWLERLTFGDLLWQCRCAHLSRLHSCRTALVIGDGDGRFTARLLEINPLVCVDAVDNSGAMLRVLLERAGSRADRVQTYLADARTFTPPRFHYDLVVTHFFLDCLTTQEVADLANDLRSRVTSSSLWVVSDFAIPPGWFGYIVARPIETALYVAFNILARTRVFRLPDHRQALSLTGFALQSERTFASRLLISEVWSIGRNDSSADLDKPQSRIS